MMNSFLRPVVLALMVLLGLTSVAIAENRAGAVTVSPMAGAQLFKSSEGFQDAGFLGLNLGYNFTKNWGAELTGTVADVDYEDQALGSFNYWTGRVDLLYHFRPDQKFVPYFAAGVGMTAMPTPVSGAADSVDEDLMANYGVGFKYFTTDWLALRLDARQAVRHEYAHKPTTHGKNYSNFLLSGGLLFQMGGDRPAPMVIQQADSDGDGVIDALDSCFGTPAGVAVDGSGCPLDSDDDGVIDAVDQCPETPAGTEVDPQGCALIVVTAMIEDGDNDGVADSDDKCPNTPIEVPVNERGCPADTDRDGVFDIDDKCPGTEAGKSVDADGCEIDYSAMEELKLEITFASNSSVIDPQFYSQLQRAADFIKAHPGKKLLVEGHTDNTGSASVNMKLSQKRADTVRWVLVRDYGADRNNLTARGFGEKKPIADNSTLDGRNANRRVLIRLVD